MLGHEAQSEHPEKRWGRMLVGLAMAAAILYGVKDQVAVTLQEVRDFFDPDQQTESPVEPPSPMP